ncbi:MAG TPA: hypothetical protein VG370_34935 [Chloroflexota bacterium]|jgi:hypothetical protein|nr:hypothetical protein [Chloroflexota bacterium]
MPAFGRLRVEDPRDRLFPLRALSDARAAAPGAAPVRQWALFGLPLDQGEESTCVGHAWKHWMLCAPVIQTRARAEPLATTIYDLATLADEWSGNERDRAFGTSVRAAGQVLRGLGYVDAFHWETTVDGCIRWVQFGGPLVVGTDWTASMMTPEHGVVRVDEGTAVLGGHAWVLNGWDPKRGLFDAINSWGSAWGLKGRFRVPAEDLRVLLEGRGGEAVAAPEVRLPKAERPAG